LNATQKQVAAGLERAFRDLKSEAGPASRDPRTAEFVFHMTDWGSDLTHLADLYSKPTGRSRDEWVEGVMGFAYHAIGHLLAAARLLDGRVENDPFNVITPKPRRSAQLKAKARKR
jgi:hypothetical protein